MGNVAAGALLVSVLLGVLKAALPVLPNSVLVKSAMEIATVKLEVALIVDAQVRYLPSHVRFTHVQYFLPLCIDSIHPCATSCSRSKQQ